MYHFKKKKAQMILKIIPNFKDNKEEIKEQIPICTLSTGVIIQNSTWYRTLVFSLEYKLFSIFSTNNIPPQITYSLLALFNKKGSVTK